MKLLLDPTVYGYVIYPRVDPGSGDPSGIIIPHGDDPLACYVYAVNVEAAGTANMIPAQAVAHIQPVPNNPNGDRSLRAQLAVYANSPQGKYWHFGSYSTFDGNLIMDLNGIDCLHDVDGHSRVYIMLLAAGPSCGMPLLPVGVKVESVGVVFRIAPGDAAA
jgi:hypothetical protein